MFNTTSGAPTDLPAFSSATSSVIAVGNVLLKAIHQGLRKGTRRQPSARSRHYIAVRRPCRWSLRDVDDLARKRVSQKCRINEPRNNAIGVPIGVTVVDAEAAREQCLL